VGIITRAVVFPEKEPVQIYMTNPVSKVVWQKILSYWFQVSRLDKSKNMPRGDELDFEALWHFSWEKHGDALTELLNEAIKSDTEITDSVWKPMVYGPDNPYFQFYVLRPDVSYGQIIAGPVMENNLHDSDERMREILASNWEPITPYDDLTNQFLNQKFQKEFHGLGEQTTTPETTEMVVENGESVRRRTVIPKTPKATPKTTKMVIENGERVYRRIIIPETLKATPGHDPQQYFENLFGNQSGMQE
jgi:hypothetical protein